MTSRTGSAAPPRAALALLTRAVRHADPDADWIVGDMVESFQSRVERGRRFNGAWFWSQALLFALIRGGAVSRAWRILMTRSIGTSVRQAVRRLTHEWRYSAGVVAILAIGIGPASAMLSILNDVLMKPLAYDRPDRLAIVRIQLGQIKNHPGMSLDEVRDLRALTDVFAGVEAESRAADGSFGPPDRLEAITTVGITPGLLPMLGVTPIHGRQLVDDDDGTNGGEPGVLVDHAFWVSHFGGSPSAVGSAITLNGQHARVVGVLPEGFTLTTGRAVPQPFEVYRALRLFPSRNFWAFPTLVRLKEGMTIGRANERLHALAAALVKQYPKAYSDAAIEFAVHPLLDDMVQDVRPALRASLAGVLLLLLVAVANATALAMARLKTRERDLALRGALGAGRGALVFEVLIESVVLCVYAAVAGGVFALGAVAAVRRIIPHTVPRWQQIGVGWDVLLFAAALSFAGLLLLGLLPVLRVVRGSTWQTLRGGAVQGGRAEGAAARLALVGGQIALTVVLAFGAVQLVRSASRLSQVDLGFDAGVMTVRVPVNFGKFKGPGEVIAMYHRVRDRLASVPGVTAVGAISHLPLSGTALGDSYSRDFSREPGWDSPVANYYTVLPGYFGSMKIPLVAGRDFTDLDDKAQTKAVIVDESLARSVFGGAAAAVGQELNVGYQIGRATIVGVVGHARGIEVAREVRPQVYAPMGVFFNPPMNYTIRLSADAAALRGPIRAAIEEIGPGAALSGFTMLTDNVDRATSTLRAVTDFVTSLAISAGLLSTIGLYIVIAYVIHQRRRSSAIRCALGASPAQIVGHHLKTTGWVILAALPVGAGLAVAAAPLFSSLVYGVAPRDVTSLSIAAGLAVIAGVLGTYVPIRRAAAADVVRALRAD